jgi:ornithine cyclodeaminase/alanine dehydrogenase-like protein (mu-crystallin family)
VFDGNSLEEGQVVVSIANSEVTIKRSEVDRRTYERATTIIVNDWESVIDSEQTELLDPIKDGIIRREHVYKLGDLILGKVEVSALRRGGHGQGIIYYKNNSGLAIPVCRRGRHDLSQSAGRRLK